MREQFDHPISVVGMHRSGTSMVTGMLTRCGLQVGPSHELLGASQENPTGYFERRPIVLLNDEVLDAFGFAWDHLPNPLPNHWIDDPLLTAIKEQARKILATFDHATMWGFKDPRASLLLEFWESLLDPNSLPKTTGSANSDNTPHAPFVCVVCVRNPLDVAASLARRGGMSLRLALHLWHKYTQAALELAYKGPHIVTHYDAYFEDTAAEISRVCDAIGLEPKPSELSAAIELSDARHRHGSAGLSALVDSVASDEIVALYLEALALAGPIMTRVASRDSLVLENDGEPFNRAETTAWVAEYRKERRATHRSGAK